MIIWSDYYRLSAEEVEAIGTSESADRTHPYILTVYLKSGNKFSVSYIDKKSRQAAMTDLSRQIDSEKRRDAERIQNALFLLQDCANRIDKRQLRIWRQLHNLMGLQTEED